jgi:hypothetical protein
LARHAFHQRWNVRWWRSQTTIPSNISNRLPSITITAFCIRFLA